MNETEMILFDMAAVNKKVVFYGRRNTGLVVLTYLWGKYCNVKVISDDEHILDFAAAHGLEVVDFDTMGDYSLLVCCHGNKIIDKKYLKENRCINIHPCLWKYRGHNPVKRHIIGRDSVGSVESQWLISEVDAGDVIHQEFFDTPNVNDYAGFYNLAFPHYLKCIKKTLDKIEL